MKYIFKTLIVAVFAIFSTGCGGGGSSSNSGPVVNLIGTWDYLIITENSICDGLAAQGVEIVENLNGDQTKIGNIILDGTGFGVDAYQNCYIKPVYKVISQFQGTNSEMDVNEFKRMIDAENAGDNTIASISIDSFTNNKIVETYTFKNGVIIRETLAR